MAYYSPYTQVLLDTQTATSSTSLSFTSKITSSYSLYLLIFSNIIPATDNVVLQLLFSTDNGSTYLGSGYRWSYTILSSAGTNTLANNNSDTSTSFAGSISNNSSRGVNGYMNLYCLNSANIPNFSGIVGHYASGDTANQNIFVGTNTGTTPVNAIKIQMSSGNIASGKIYLYGLNTN